MTRLWLDIGLEIASGNFWEALYRSGRDGGEIWVAGGQAVASTEW